MNFDSIISIFIIIIFAKAGTTKIDSLENLLKSSSDTSRLSTIILLVWEYRGINPDKSLSYAEEGYLLADKLKQPLKKGKLYGWLISLTFIIYVFYDISNFLINTGILYAPFMDISKEFLYSLFFLATLSIVWAVWEMYVEAK